LNRNIKRKLFLGLDTSAYTTSLALVDQDQKLVYERRIPLEVKNGVLGLRQSEAVFAHINNIKNMWPEEILPLLAEALTAIASAVQPRPLKNSYMPVFKVSEALGLFVAQTMGLQYFSASHQEGHVMAGLWSAKLGPGRYLVLHLSGGTTELISAEASDCGLFKINLLGGTADLNAGQFIDRIGKVLGLKFPAGPQLEILALAADMDIPILPQSVKHGTISFSGPASHAERLFQSGCPAGNLARAVEICIAESMIRASNNILEQDSNFDGLLAVGGVTANNYIRKCLAAGVKRIPIFFASPEYAADNAVGIAVIALRRSFNR
jgi:N6-L-threonylcarbamoyladenine synthase